MAGNGPVRQRGSVLVVVLLLLAVAVAIGTATVYRSSQSIVRSSNLMDWDKRYQYGIAAETIAIQALQDDLEYDRSNNSPGDDCVNEKWGIQLPPTPYGDAVLEASVQDLQGRFNLNWLVSNNNGQWLRDQDSVDALTRLLTTVLGGVNSPTELAEQMADWIDEDTIANSVSGAEDSDYPARRTPNLPVLHESEMRALKAFTAPVQTPLFWSYFTALPVPGTLNVNTAPDAVLSAVIDDSAFSGAILSQRKTNPFTNISDVFALQAATNLSQDKRKRLDAMLGVKSEYFQVMVDVRVGESTSRLMTRIHRPNDPQKRTAVFSRAILPVMDKIEPPCNPP